MQVKLSFGIIETKLKRSFVVYIDGNMYRNRTHVERNTTHVELTSIDASSIEDSKYPKSTTFGSILVPIEIASRRIVKFIAIYKSKDKEQIISVNHNSSTNIEEYLNENELWEHFKSTKDIYIMGKIQPSLTNITVNDRVVITEIGIIDKYKLYNIAERQGKIVDIKDFKVTIELDINKTRIICNRVHFKLLNNNAHFLFDMACPYCKR